MADTHNINRMSFEYLHRAPANHHHSMLMRHWMSPWGPHKHTLPDTSKSP